MAARAVVSAQRPLGFGSDLILNDNLSTLRVDHRNDSDPQIASLFLFVQSGPPTKTSSGNWLRKLSATGMFRTGARADWSRPWSVDAVVAAWRTGQMPGRITSRKVGPQSDLEIAIDITDWEDDLYRPGNHQGRPEAWSRHADSVHLQLIGSAPPPANNRTSV